MFAMMNNESSNVGKEFYVVLPSNGCPEIHPDNTPAKFNISWETPMHLATNDNWAVALTEANFCYLHQSVTTYLGVEYSIFNFKYKIKVEIEREEMAVEGRIQMYEYFFKIHGKTKTYSIIPDVQSVKTEELWKKIHLHNQMKKKQQVVRIRDEQRKIRSATGEIPKKKKLIYNKVNISFSPENKSENLDHEMPEIDFYSGDGVHFLMKHPFTLNVVIDNREIQIVAKRFSSYNGDRKYRLRFPIVLIRKTGKIIGSCTISCHSDHSTTKRVFISDNNLWDDANKMAASLAKDFKDVFSGITFKDNRFLVTVKNHITTFSFINRLNIILGFNQAKHLLPERGENDEEIVLTGNFPPSLKSGINHLYIYASICKPIQVGGVQVPLLKSIWMDGTWKNFEQGDLCNVVMKNPMYIPLCTSSINTIEVNIRSDSGELIPFIDGSITSLTLHFKKM